MYSNCLFEAIKAKIKDPKNVKIVRLPKEVNGKCQHFMWLKGEYVYHAFHKNPDDENNFWFEYKIKKVPLIIFQRWLLSTLINKCLLEKYVDKFDLPLSHAKAIRSYEFFTTDEECLLYDENFDWSEADAVYAEIKKFMKKEPQIKVIDVKEKTMSILSFEELKQLKGNFNYKFLTPYDEDFKSMYVFSSNLERADILETYEE